MYILRIFLAWLWSFDISKLFSNPYQLIHFEDFLSIVEPPLDANATAHWYLLDEPVNTAEWFAPEESASKPAVPLFFEGADGDEEGHTPVQPGSGATPTPVPRETDRQDGSSYYYRRPAGETKTTSIDVRYVHLTSRNFLCPSDK